MTARFAVRPLETEKEVGAFFRMCILAFWPAADQASTVAWWQRWVAGAPDFEPRHIRAVFTRPGGEMVGGCVVHERDLRLPPALLRTSCIALVATHPDYRRQGVAHVLLEDVVVASQARGEDLLLLGGIPNFYHRFGFVDIFDETEHLIDRASVLRLPPSACAVRPATVEDAPTLLELYRRHHDGYTGSFTRTLDQQRHRLRFRAADSPALLAFTPAGEPSGYMLCVGGGARAEEVAAESWDAALALLQHQAQMVEALPEAPTELIWAAPPQSPTLFFVLDNLPFSYAPPLPPYPNWYVVRSIQRHLPLAGKMARPADLQRLVLNVGQHWSAARRARGGGWTGTLGLMIGDRRFEIAAEGSSLEVRQHIRRAAVDVRLEEGMFMQLLFGFRNVAWAALQPGQHVDPGALPLLQELFPLGYSWFAASDSF